MSLLRRHNKPIMQEQKYNDRWEDIMQSVNTAMKRNMDWSVVTGKIKQNKSYFVHQISSNLRKLSQILQFCEATDSSVDTSFILLDPAVIKKASESERHTHQLVRVLTKHNLLDKQKFWKTLSQLQQPKHFRSILKDSYGQKVEKYIKPPPTQTPKKIFGSQPQNVEIPQMILKIKQIHIQSKDSIQKIQNHLLSSSYSPQMLNLHLQYTTNILKHNNKSSMIVIPRFQRRINDWVAIDPKNVNIRTYCKYLLELSKHQSIDGYINTINQIFQANPDKKYISMILSLLNTIQIDSSKLHVQINQLSDIFMKMRLNPRNASSYAQHLQIYKIFCTTQRFILPLKLKMHCKNQLRQHMESPTQITQNGILFFYLWCLSLDDFQQAKRFHKKHKNLLDDIMKRDQNSKNNIIQVRQYAQAMVNFGFKMEEIEKMVPHKQNLRNSKLTYLQQNVVNCITKHIPQAKIVTNLQLFPYCYDVVLGNIIFDCLGNQHQFKEKLDRVRQWYAEKQGYKIVIIRPGDNIQDIIRPLL